MPVYSTPPFHRLCQDWECGMHCEPALCLREAFSGTSVMHKTQSPASHSQSVYTSAINIPTHDMQQLNTKPNSHAGARTRETSNCTSWRQHLKHVISISLSAGRDYECFMLKLTDDGTVFSAQLWWDAITWYWRDKKPNLLIRQLNQWNTTMDLFFK